MELINVRIFREKLKDFFDKADKGDNVFIKRKNQTYKLIAVDDLEKDIQQSKNLEKK